MYLFVCNLHFSKVAKKLSAGNCSTGTVRQYFKLNSLRFLNKGFVHCLWCDLLTLNAIVACFRLQKTNLLVIDFLATWHLDQYNRYNCCQQNYAVNMLSWWTESSLASHNNFGTYPDSSCGQFTARSSELIRLLLMLIKLHTVCKCLKFVAIHACCLCWFSTIWTITEASAPYRLMIWLLLERFVVRRIQTDNNCC